MSPNQTLKLTVRDESLNVELSEEIPEPATKEGIEDAVDELRFRMAVVSNQLHGNSPFKINAKP